MRPEISNELLLQVIQAWDPDESGGWEIHSATGTLCAGNFGVRHRDGEMFCHVEASVWRANCELVEFLLKDRPELVGDFDPDRWPYLECKKACNGFWTLDPWESSTTPDHMVRRIKSYEYLKAWKENREIGEQLEKRYDEMVEDQENAINPHDVTLSIEGQAIEGMEICDDVLSVPATYEKICPHCNGSKEVTGWLGKESCQACL